jgi:hypothetical protein
MESQIHDSAPPAALLKALERKNANLRYTDAMSGLFGKTASSKPLTALTVRLRWR